MPRSPSRPRWSLHTALGQGLAHGARQPTQGSSQPHSTGSRVLKTGVLVGLPVSYSSGALKYADSERLRAKAEKQQRNKRLGEGAVGPGPASCSGSVRLHLPPRRCHLRRSPGRHPGLLSLPYPCAWPPDPLPASWLPPTVRRALGPSGKDPPYLACVRPRDPGPAPPTQTPLQQTPAHLPTGPPPTLDTLDRVNMTAFKNEASAWATDSQGPRGWAEAGPCHTGHGH